jgi:pectinesterase
MFRSTHVRTHRRWVVFVAALVAAPLAAVVIAVLPSEAASAPVAGGVYTLVPGASGKCVEVPSSSTASGTLLTQATCSSGATRQQWRVVANSTKYNLINVNSGMCIDVPSATTTTGQQLQQWGCGTAQNNQLWTFTASTAAPGKYHITSAATSLCLSDKDSSTAATNPIIQETCSDISRMQIAFNPIGAATTGPANTTTVAADGTGTYRTVQAAIDAVPANNTTRRVITIKAGTYREIVTVPSNKPYVTLQGVGPSASSTVIVNNHSSAAGFGTSGSATLFASAHDLTATNLTISNDYGEGSQAVAANVSADRQIFNSVRFLGNQDTLLVNEGARAYLVNSYVEGTVDFVFGGGTAVFNTCSIYERRATGGPITAANTASSKTYGLLFYRSSISGAVNNVTQLGRPWGASAQVLYRESTLSATIATAQPWTDMSSNTWQNARFFEYRNTGSGATTNSNRPQLSDSTAANYTPQKYLAGTDGLNPM